MPAPHEGSPRREPPMQGQDTCPRDPNPPQTAPRLGEKSDNRAEKDENGRICGMPVWMGKKEMNIEAEEKTCTGCE